MKKKQGEPVEIEPIPFRSKRRQGRTKLIVQYRWFLAAAAGLIFVLLSMGVWYVFTAKQVVIRIDPEPDDIIIHGSLFAPQVAGYYLLRPGKYTLQAVKECFGPLEYDFEVGDEKTQPVERSMERLPGRLSLTVNRSDQPSAEVTGARVYVDGQEVGNSPIRDVEVASGPRHLEVQAKDYKDFTTDVVIDGCGVLQSFSFGLVPGWADVTISAIPRNASVLIDGNLSGTTPLDIRLLEGTYQVEITATGFKTWTSRLEVLANEAQELKDVRLEPADGSLALKTNPGGANVMVGNAYAGQTPLKIPLARNTVHDIRI